MSNAAPLLRADRLSVAFPAGKGWLRAVDEVSFTLAEGETLALVGESGGGKETNALDDDANGFADDVHGWDFANGDNNPSPINTNGHGTGTAGVAAGIFSTASKTAGRTRCTFGESPAPPWPMTRCTAPPAAPPSSCTRHRPANTGQVRW